MSTCYSVDGDTSVWPAPSEQAKRLSLRLRTAILEEIAKTGPLTFADYMQRALYTPGLGYYSSGLQKWGESGDYVTAPLVSPLFSYCIARQVEAVLRDITGACILELGAGSGHMAADILCELERLQALPERYYILEVSAELQRRQQDYLKAAVPHLLARVHWWNKWPTEPINGVIIANEVMDAIPVHKFNVNHGIQEYFVAARDQNLIWEQGEPHSEALLKKIEQLGITNREGYDSEMHLWLSGWLTALAEHLNRGIILLIDYGFPRHEYYHPDRNRGTIMCHYRHRAHPNPLLLIGLQDITVHIDFTSVAEVATQQGLAVGGFTHQAAFLINCGLSDYLSAIQDQPTYNAAAQQVKCLVLPSEMGELFKVMALTRGYDKPLIGFADMNQIERLYSPPFQPSKEVS